MAAICRLTQSGRVGRGRGSRQGKAMRRRAGQATTFRRTVHVAARTAQRFREGRAILRPRNDFTDDARPPNLSWGFSKSREVSSRRARRGVSPAGLKSVTGFNAMPGQQGILPFWLQPRRPHAGGWARTNTPPHPSLCLPHTRPAQTPCASRNLTARNSGCLPTHTAENSLFVALREDVWVGSLIFDVAA